MSESGANSPTVVCIASYFKGVDFIRECRDRGCRVFLLTREKVRHEDWPLESLDGFVTVRDDAGPEEYIHAVVELGRPQRIDRVVALEEYDVIMAGRIREHLCMPGMNSATARRFRDKLAMRVAARQAGIRVPDFVHLFDYQSIGEFMERVPPPWVLKPRADVSAVGIQKLEESERVWRAIDALDARECLRERSSFYLLERFVPGEVYHVDSLVEDGRVIFAGANRYGRPPMDVAHGGGVFISQTVEYGSDIRHHLFELNQQLISTLGLVRGASHAEFIRGHEDGHLYFLEIAARVGGAYTAEALEAASGINLWRGWARLEIARGEQPVELKPSRQDYSGIALSLSRQEYPDTSSFVDPEIVYRVRKRHHVGLVVSSPDAGRVTELLHQYARRFDDEFSAVLPPPERLA